MHILPAYFTTTNTRKRKKPKKPASLIEADRRHAKFLKKMNISSRSLKVKHPFYKRLNVSRLESDLGSSPGGSTNRSVAQSGSASALGAGGQKFKSSHSDQFPLSDDIPVGVAPKKEVIPHNFTIAPAYNKGPYQVINKNDIKDIGR